MALSLDSISGIFLCAGSAQYGGEAVTQLQHALQCAYLAEQSDAIPELVAAALLHDLGHLLPKRDWPSAANGEDLHQYLALAQLRGTFSEAVLAPIRLHVDAKRYLCAVDTGYWAGLSPASKCSLEMQGGIYSSLEADAFMAQAHAADAVALRRWDDLSKDPAASPPGWSHFIGVLEQARLAG